jgi:glycosyltransferase involved in cell wall biosynthesis
MTKLALLAPRYAPSIGGVEAHVAGIAGGMAARGAEVAVLTQARQASSRVDGAVAVHAFREVVPSEAYPVAPGMVAWLRRHAAELDVVHAHSYHGVPALAGALATSGPFVFTPHYHGTGHTSFARFVHRGYGMLGRRIFDRADRVVCVSEAEASLVAKHHPMVASRIEVIPNGVDVDAIDTAEPFVVDAPVVLVLGRLVSYKRVDAVIRAMAPLAAEAELVVLGDGTDRAGLQRLAAEHGVRSRFLGRVPAGDVARWLQTATVVVSASEREAFGLTLLEALTGGARVVASALPAHREVAATWGSEGGVELVEDRAELTGAIRSQLAAGRLSRAVRPRWSWDEVAARTESLYDDVLGRVAC